MKYRIVKKTYSSGLSWYYIQEKILFFWIYLVKDYYGFYGLERISFSSLDSAQEHIKQLSIKTNNKVIKKEILK